jgi:adenylate cyclase
MVMGIEIERKFLLKDDCWREQVITSTRISQGYLTQNEGKSSVRVRLSGDKANLNIKSRELAISRQEYEYSVPVEDAQKMLDTLCTGIIDKVRHHVEFQGHTWEIDEFLGDNSGLIVAEIELESEDSKFPPPDWLGKEVSHDPRYYNVNLISHPYCRW